MNKFDEGVRVIIMCGISGSGKTRIARKLEEEGYTRLSTDALIWDRVGSNLFELPPEEQKLLFEECRTQVRNQLAGLLASGFKVVVDATHCRRAARDEMRSLYAGAGVRPVFIYCSADEKELWRRLSLRKGSGPDDLIVTRKELACYWLGFERPQEDETDFISADKLSS